MKVRWVFLSKEVQTEALRFFIDRNLFDHLDLYLATLQKSHRTVELQHTQTGESGHS